MLACLFWYYVITKTMTVKNILNVALSNENLILCYNKMMPWGNKIYHKIFYQSGLLGTEIISNSPKSIILINNTPEFNKNVINYSHFLNRPKIISFDTIDFEKIKHVGYDLLCTSEDNFNKFKFLPYSAKFYEQKFYYHCDIFAQQKYLEFVICNREKSYLMQFSCTNEEIENIINSAKSNMPYEWTKKYVGNEIKLDFDWFYDTNVDVHQFRSYDKERSNVSIVTEEYLQPILDKINLTKE